MKKAYLGVILLGFPLGLFIGALVWSLGGAKAVLVLCVAVAAACSIAKGITILVDEGVL